MQKKINNELKKLLQFIEWEKAEELNEYHAALQNHSFNDQRENGICWYPVELEKSKFDTGERLIIYIYRMPEHTHTHKFQSGKLVRLFRNTNGEIADNEFVTGVVNSVKDNEMVITLNAGELPEWVNRKNLGVQLLFDEKVYKEMTAAIQFLLETDDKNILQLKETLLGNKNAEFEQKSLFTNPYLNTKQNEALNKILSAKDLAIIHGPPGTGKTTTLVQTIIYTLNTEKQVLVTAQSNAAVDLLVEKLHQKGINVVRLGHPARITEEILETTLDTRFARHDSYKNLRAVKRQAQEYRNLAQKYKRKFGKEEREQRQLLYKEARQLTKEVEQLSFYIESDILDKAQVIACTLIGAAQENIKGRKFKTVFIDEASQALEPASWIPVLKAQRVIFAGDHYQLPPTIKSYRAAKEGFQETLFEKAIRRNNADVMLNVQYRMHQKIMQFSSQQFYKNELKADEKVANHSIMETDNVFEFIDTAGTGFFEQRNDNSKSISNLHEVTILFKHLLAYIEEIEAYDAVRNLKSIGIISPYKEQCTALKKSLSENDYIPAYIKNIIDINTIDAFQGQERDVIYISLVRSNEKNDIGFLSDIRRMNVALTRARKKLIVIGDSATISKSTFYNEFLNYIEKNAFYRTAFEYMYS